MIKFFKSEAEIIAEIHEDFDNAQQALLADAKRVLETTKIAPVDNRELAVRLERLGFTKAAQVTKVKEEQYSQLPVKMLRNLAANDANTITYYQKAYPFLKFLTLKELDRLCKKWKLIYAPVGAYKEAVPVKNLEDIERAQKLHHDDQPYFLIHFESGNSPGTKLLKSICESGNSITAHQLLKIHKELTGSSYHSIPDMKNSWSVDRVMGDIARALNLPRASVVFRGVSELNGLMIAAPQKHFDLKGVTNVQKHGWLAITAPKDPIVFRFVKGGVQVLTKWGLEASDPALINAIDN